MESIIDKKDPVYCPNCLLVLEFIPRSEKLKHLGSVISCSGCNKRYVVNEGKYFLLMLQDKDNKNI